MEITRIKTGEWGKTRAFFDITTKEGFEVKGFKVVEGINGLFVGFPSEEYKDSGGETKYKFTAYLADEEKREKFQKWAIGKYQEENKNHSSTPAVEYESDSIPF